MSRLTFILVTLILAGSLRGQVTPGEILMAEMNCAACHNAGELAERLDSRQSPRLGPDGVRSTAQWLQEFIADPQRTQPGTLMPDLLHGMAPAEKAEAAEAITHFLLSLQPPAQEKAIAVT
jgi:cytochrome c1